MNWLHKLKFRYKISQTNYLDIGHGSREHRNKYVFLWMIDKNFNFYKQKIKPPLNEHNDWEAFRKLVNINILAFGRYDKKTHIASNTFVDNFNYLKEEAEKMTKNILNSEFNFPRIYDFGWPEI